MHALEYQDTLAVVRSKQWYIIREVSFFTWRGGGGLWKFFKFCNFLVIPCCLSKIFVIPSEALQNFSDPPPPHNKSSRISFCINSKLRLDHPFSLLKVKAGNLRGIAVRVKLEKKNDKNPTVSISFTLLTGNLADNYP